MQQMRLSLFYNLQDVIRKSDFHRKYDLLFQSLDLSAVRDTNTGIGRTGYSRHTMLRAFIVKHLEGIKSVLDTSTRILQSSRHENACSDRFPRARAPIG